LARKLENQQLALQLWRRNVFDQRYKILLSMQKLRNSIKRSKAQALAHWKSSLSLRKLDEDLLENSEAAIKNFDARLELKTLKENAKRRGLSEGLVNQRLRDSDIKKLNLLQKSVSRIILNSSDCVCVLKAFNSWSHVASMMKKWRRGSRIVINLLRKSDLFLAFRTWSKETFEYHDILSTHNKTQLCKK
jgi:hypothetical protein